MSRELYEFERHLRDLERSRNTIEKYMRDVKKFLVYLHGREFKRELVISYKEKLKAAYRISSVNSMIAAVNQYLKFIGREDCCVKLCRVQQQIFREDSRNLTKEEYMRLLEEAKKSGALRLSYILQTIASTGIRVSELSGITVESLAKRMAKISSKGKVRIILIPDSLALMLIKYCKKEKIETGSVFVTRTGRPIDRKNIWMEMKKLCAGARVNKEKVFPHNLRHLFACCYYQKEKDLVRLADYMGHSSVDTTRRYTMISSMEICLKELELGLSPALNRIKIYMT